MSREWIAGRLVLDDRVASGRLAIEDGVIAAVETDGAQEQLAAPFVMPGFVDVHVHGWGGHDAMGGREALDGMSRTLLRRGVTSFLPTGVTSAIPDLVRFAETVRDWMPDAPTDGARPLGFDIEGPFISQPKRGAHPPALVRSEVDVPFEELQPLVEGLRIMTVAPEIPGGLGLIAWLAGHGVKVSMGHSASTVEEARAGYAAGGRTTTHLFNGMSGVDHRAPGLAVAALTDDEVFVELIADGHHVHVALWDLIRRAKPASRLILVSDALSLSGTGPGRTWVSGTEVEVLEDRAVVAGTTTLAGSVLALDGMVRNLVRSGVPLPAASAAGSRNPLELLEVTDRGRLAPGQRADLVELGDDLAVRRVMLGGVWHQA
jgi:N-acetylglucosamine-6-phosphate deacetylase